MRALHIRSSHGFVPEVALADAQESRQVSRNKKLALMHRQTFPYGFSSK